MNPNIKRMQTVNAPDTTSVQRNVVARTNSGRRTENEPFAANVVDHGLLAGNVNLPAQSTHVHVDEIAPEHELVAPDFLEHHGPSATGVSAASCIRAGEIRVGAARWAGRR